MKRLNKKGFTLVELLAVIVILAIVVGITLVTVLPTLKNARQEAFELTAQTAADYFEKQYQLYLIGEEVPEDIKDLITTSLANPGIMQYIEPVQLEYTGLKLENYIAAKWKINEATGRACVNLYASTKYSASQYWLNLKGSIKAGEYYDAKEKGDSIKVYTTTTWGKSYDQLTSSGNAYSKAQSSGC